MTDKQIIIDEVDVSGCKHFHYDECLNLEETVSACKYNPNCLFKQLARKTQECEKLKKYLNQIRDEELSHLDIGWDEYETSVRQDDYSNIITLVERALGEIDD